MAEYLTWANRRLLEEYEIEEPPADPALVRDGLAAYRPPHALVLLAESGARAVAVGALRRHVGGVAEVKRMYVRPEARREGIGAAMLDRLLEEAGAMDVETLRLDTCRFMTGAQRLYRSRGFVEREPYDESEIPPRLRHHWLFFERRLEA